MADTILPAALQAEKDRLQAESATENTPVEALASTEPATKPAPTEEKVTISREEFNELQAAAGRTKAAEGRVESLRVDVQALEGRLTDLEAGAKGSPESETSPSFVPEEYSNEELNDYGESRGFVEKTASNVCGKMLADFRAEIYAKLQEVKGAAEAAVNTATATNARSFTDRVRAAVPDFEEIVKSKHWGAFLDSVDPMSGDQYSEIITKNVRKENLPGMEAVFNKFKSMYVGKESGTTGYAGVVPSGTTTNVGTDTKKIMKFSERTALNKRYINKEISNEDYLKLKAEFDLADRENRLDYNS